MITSEFKEAETKETYPILKIDSKGLIVLFAGATTGTVLRSTIYSDGGAYIGYYSEEWAEGRFTALKGTVILKNM